MGPLTPATRALDALGVPYRVRTYEAREHTAAAVAHALGIEPGRIFKTLLVALLGDGHGLFLVPGDRELDLRRAAEAAGAKRAELARREDVPRLTGYVPGGVSPLGTRRPLPVWVDRSALAWDEISVSAGRRGAQIQIAPEALIGATGARLAELASSAGDRPR
ncbi:MAG: aminoacyl-tRNA deacylase [Clostridia bacterium]|nr:aminoacyl-tRNA deacylase [Clostridia bacterium]